MAIPIQCWKFIHVGVRFTCNKKTEQNGFRMQWRNEICEVYKWRKCVNIQAYLMSFYYLNCPLCGLSFFMLVLVHILSLRRSCPICYQSLIRKVWAQQFCSQWRRMKINCNYFIYRPILNSFTTKLTNVHNRRLVRSTCNVVALWKKCINGKICCVVSSVYPFYLYFLGNFSSPSSLSPYHQFFCESKFFVHCTGP